MIPKILFVLFSIFVLHIKGLDQNIVKCRSDVKLMDNFDLIKLKDKWYLNALYESQIFPKRGSENEPWEDNEKCLSMSLKMSVSENKQMLMEINLAHDTEYSRENITQTYSVTPKRDQCGRLELTDTGTEKDLGPGELAIIETDYSNYLILWNCIDAFNEGHAVEQIFIMSKTPENPDIGEKVTGIVQKYLGEMKKREIFGGEKCNGRIEKPLRTELR